MPVTPENGDGRERVADAASLLADARQRGKTIKGLPEACRPVTVAEAEAIQRATLYRLGHAIGAWKLGRAGGVLFAAPLPQAAVTEESSQPLLLPPGTRVELELALRFRTALDPTVLASLTLDAMAQLADLVLLIEFVRSRYDDDHAASDLEKLADCVSNQHAVIGQPTGAWGVNDLESADALLVMDGRELARGSGKHPALPLVPLIEGWRARCTADGHRVKAGEVVTLGSLTGIAPIPALGGVLTGTVAGRGAIRCIIAATTSDVTRATMQ